MSELPERKVLKDILLRLKTKTITSEERHKKLASSVSDTFEGYVGNAWNIAKDKNKEFDRKGTVAIFRLMSEQLGLLIRDSDGLSEDMKLYIEALENYCAELDKTLWTAIEQAKQQAEGQIKQQEERIKKEPTYRT